jgi:transcriptional regulator with XRE-family HTH domain
MKIGEKLNRLRKKNGLTLAELASRCELTKGFLSQLENDITSPSIATLEDILEALGTDISEFFQEQVESKIVFRKSDFFEDERDGFQISWVIPDAQKRAMEPIVITLEPGAHSFSLSPRETEEFGIVLNGSVTLHYGKRIEIIRKGETFYFEGSEEHSLSNSGKTVAKVLWVATPPSF